MWNLWWPKWRCDRFLSHNFSVFLSDHPTNAVATDTHVFPLQQLKMKKPQHHNLTVKALFSVSDLMYRWRSLLPVEVGVGISFASEIMVVPSRRDYLELECPHCQK